MIALVGGPGGWRAEAASDKEAIDITHGNPPRAREGWCGELLIWNERYCRDRRLAGDEVPASGSGPSSRAPQVAGWSPRRTLPGDPHTLRHPSGRLDYHEKP